MQVVMETYSVLEVLRHQRDCNNKLLTDSQAWIESLTSTSFELRKRFIALWRNSPFDLFYFDRKSDEKMSKRIKWLTARLEHLNLPQPGNFIEAVQQGRIGEEYFAKHGPALALQWVLGYEEAHAKPATVPAPAPPRDVDLESYLGEVDWDSDILRALLEPIDPSVPQPTRMKEKVARPAVNVDSYWISKEQIFDIIFKIDRNRDKEASVGMDVLAQMMDQTLGLE